MYEMYLDCISPPAFHLQTNRVSHSAMKSISCQARQSSEGRSGSVCVTAAIPDKECFKLLQAIRSETIDVFFLTQIDKKFKKLYKYQLKFF